MINNFHKFTSLKRALNDAREASVTKVASSGRVHRIAVFLLVFSFLYGDFYSIYLGVPRALAAEDIFTTAGTNTWVAPANTYQVTARVWGGGGGSGGGTGTSLPGGSGGGGGAYAEKIISVTPGVSYSYTVGSAGVDSGGAAGGNSSFTGDSGIQVLACGGTSGADNGGTAGTGGTLACSDGTIEFAGGAGAVGAGTSGGGGGESASTTANGNDAIGTAGGTGTAGTDGSAGQLIGVAGVAGNNPGAGAGGSGRRSGGSEAGALGGIGRIQLIHFPSSLTISGTLYSDEGATAYTGGKNIKLRAATSTPGIFSTTSNGSGAFSFSSLTGIGPGTPLSLWVDNDATFRAFAQTKASSGANNITNLDLYKDVILVRHEGTTGTSTRNIDLGLWDYTNNTSIQFDVTENNISTFVGQKLFVWHDTLFTPGGAVTTHGNAGSGVDGSFHIGSGATYTAGGTTTIAGNFTASSSAFFIPHASSTVFSATTTGKTILTSFESLGVLNFTGSGGSWTFATTSTTTNLTIGSGATVVAPSSVLAITGNYLNQGTFTHNSGTTLWGGPSSQTVSGTMTGGSGLGGVQIKNRNLAETWTSRNVPDVKFWTAVTYGNGLFVAVNSSGLATGAVMTSPDGTTWTSRNVPNAKTWRGVTYGNGLFVAVNSSGLTTGAVMTSPDGITWTSRNVPDAKWWTAVTYGNGLFVAVNTNSSATAAVMTSPDGITWTSQNVPDIKQWYAVTYANGLFVAVNGSNSATGAVMTSPDGITWTSRNVPDAKDWYGVTYANGLFVAVNNSGSATGAVMTSLYSLSDVTFSTNASTTDFTIGQNATVTAAVDLSIAGNYTNNGTFNLTRAGGITWTSRNVPNAKTWRAVTYGNGLFVAVNDNVSATGAVMTSPDGITWTSRNVPNAKAWFGVTYANGLFVAVNYDASATGAVMTSPDGITWTSRNVPDAKQWLAVTYGNGLFVAVNQSNSATAAVMTSPDGITWTSRNVPDAKRWRAVTYGNGLFAAVNDNNSATGAVMTSPDGITWTSRNVPDTKQWYGITYGNGLFVAVNNGNSATGAVMTSPDGITWTSRNVPDAKAWPAVTYANGLFVAVNNSNSATAAVMTSPDGITWTSLNVSDAKQWYGVTYANGLFVAVNSSNSATGAVMTSAVWGTINFNGTSAQTIAGNLVALSSFATLSFLGAGTKTFSNNASTTGNFTVQSDSGEVIAPAQLSVSGNYQNNSTTTMTAADTILWLSGASGQTLSGTLTGASALSDVRVNTTGTTTFANNASTTNLTIATGATAVAPTLLSISGNYQNLGIFTAGSGTTTFNGVIAQTLSGNMTGSSAFYNLSIINSSASTTFASAASTTNNFYVVTPNARLEFTASATSTFQNFIIAGTSGNEINLFSGTPGTKANIHVIGTKSVSYARVKDMDACSTSGGITVTNGVNAGSNVCWTFTGGSDPILTLLHYRWRMDHESEVSAGYYKAEDTPLFNQLYGGDRLRLRTTIENTGTGAATNYNFRLEYASSSCTAWQSIGTSAEWMPSLSSYALDYSSTTDAGGLSNPGGSTFQSGVFRDYASETGAYTLPAAYFTEHEFSISSTMLATVGLTYCFRLTNAGSLTNFIFNVQPQLFLRGDARPQSGGSSIEANGVGPIIGGGGQGGGNGSEGSGGGSPVGGGGQGGGGGVE